MSCLFNKTTKTTKKLELPEFHPSIKKVIELSKKYPEDTTLKDFTKELIEQAKKGNVVTKGDIERSSLFSRVKNKILGSEGLSIISESGDYVIMGLSQNRDNIG